jgi:Na+-translocating ferredoxin:NAD+ oxidoreductase RnfG subunit
LETAVFLNIFRYCFSSFVISLTGDTNVTRINSISGGFLCGQGVIKPQNVQLKTNSGNGLYEGYIDLVKWYADTNVLFKLVLAGTKESPGLGIRIFGSISEPKQEQDFDELIVYFSKLSARSN